MIRLTDQDARTIVQKDLDSTLIVEAAAGTGKTTELVCRMANVLMSGRARLDGLLAVTFTEPAAGEMKLRLRAEIERKRRDPATSPEELQNLAAALPLLEEARIGTIHGFCADLIRERPVEAGVDPRFEVAPEEMARHLFDLAFNRWFEAQLSNPGEGVRRILRGRGLRNRRWGSRRDDSPRGVLGAAAWELLERRDFPAPWHRDSNFDRDAEITAIMAGLEEIAGYAANGEQDDWLTKSLIEIRDFIGDVFRRDAVRGRDFDGVEAELVGFSRARHWKWKGRLHARHRFNRDTVLARRDEIRQALLRFVSASGADIAPVLREDLRPVIDAYEQLKRAASRLDFLDLLLRARDLIRDNRRVRQDYQERFSHLFIDEFQDTDPVQAEVLLLLSADDPEESDWRRVRPKSGKLFIVGDPKQSIYRFRRADLALYEEVKERILSSGGRLVNLTVSFRAVPELQKAANAAFEPLLPGGSDRQARYVPLAPYRDSYGAQPALIALPVPRPYGEYGDITNWAIEESLPDAVAAFVDWLVTSSGWRVVDRESGERVPVQPRHVCLLFRRLRAFFADVSRSYVRALEARNLPHVLVGGASFHTREEVEAVRNALRAIERPADELSLFATLRGPLFGFTDGELLAYHERCGSFSPFSPTPDDLPAELRGVTDSLRAIRDLHRRRNDRPFADTISELLAVTRAHAGFAIWPTGEQALANVLRLMDLARRAERGGIISFRGFIEYLIEQKDRGQAGDAPILEEGTEGVRIMTVHKAKGLEFPVVVLADMTANETPREPSRWVDAPRKLCALKLAGCIPPEVRDHAAEEMVREQEEAIRLAYVATTRARDLLVVPVLGDGRQDGWLGSLNRAVYPSQASFDRPETSRPSGCPQFGRETVIRPDNVPRPVRSVAPGLHSPEAGSHRVVWWDPTVLALDVEESAGLRQQRILEVDEGGLHSDEGIRAHNSWQAERLRVREAGASPALTVSSVTETSMARETPETLPLANVTVETLPLDPARPVGRRFGNLVHGVLAVIDLDARKDQLQAAIETTGRNLGATEEETEASLIVIEEALHHPIMLRAAVAARLNRCRRECPLTIRLEGGSLLEGVVDAAFMEIDPTPTWTVVDFKTDAELRGRLDQYRRQLSLYLLGVSQATGLPTSGTLLRI